MHVLDDEQQRLPLAETPDEAGDGRPLPAVAGRIVHCVVKRAQRRRLGQVQKIVQIDALLIGQQAVAQRSFGGGLRRGRRGC